MFDLFNNIKKKAFEEGYKAGYKLAEAEGNSKVLVAKIDAYNRGYFDGTRSYIREVLLTLKEKLDKEPKAKTVKKTAKKKVTKKGK